VLLANPAAAELGGADESGAHVHDASHARWFWADGTSIHPDDLPHARALRGETVAMSDVIRRDHDSGHEKILSVSAVPLHHGRPDSSPVAEAGPLAVVVMRDVTWQRAQQRVQEDFVAVVAHDLKGPVSGVLSWAEMAQEQLRSGAETDIRGAGDSVERICRTAARMNTLITDLLDYSVAGSAHLQVRVIDLDELVDSLSADLERPDSAAAISHARLGEVYADPLLIRQVFGNLFANAIKYVAPAVAPQIRVEAQRLESSIEISVSDRGVGIPEHDRPLIFDSFYRASQTNALPGSGLGLAICRRAVERHGGWIAARGGPDGTGTTIVFTLPLTQDQAAPGDALPTARTTPGGLQGSRG
jgi:signal transduction histidine kinase